MNAFGAIRRFALPVFALASAAAAQRPGPLGAGGSSPLVQLRFVTSCGMCTGDYATTELIISPQQLTMRLEDPTHQRRLPFFHRDTRHASITKEDWNHIQSAIDSSTRAAFVGRIGCPGCFDGVSESIELVFADSTKRAVGYNLGERPPALTELTRRIHQIGKRVGF
jgi:hypothetical protein